MTAISYRFLNVDKFQTLNNWSATQAVSNNDIFSKKYKFLRIGDLLEKSKLPILIQDNTTYKRVTIKLHGNGVKVRDTVLGKEIKTKRLFLLKKGQFVYSRIDARNGAFGLAKDDVDNAVITNDFPAFDVNHKLITPDFLSMITGSKPFFDFCQSLSSGTTGRQRMDENSFLGFEIPLPDLPTQNQLINQYNKNLAKAQKAENQASELEKGIESYLLEELGIEKPKVVERKMGLQFVRLQDLSRWDLWSLPKHSINTRFRLHKLEKLISISSGSFLPNKNQIEGDYPVYGGNGVNGKHNEYSCEGKRLIIGRVGEKCGNIHLVDGKYWITDNAFKVDLISDNTTYEYLEVILKFIDLNRFKKASAQPSLSQSSILNLEIPLPNFDEQNEFVKKYNIQKEQIKNLRQQAEKLRKQAKENFEKEIFVTT